MFDRNIPYNTLPMLPPDAEVDSKEILKKAIKANKALAKLVGSGRQLPNQSMLINAISLQEAKMSSAIENIITTNDELYQALSAEKSSLDPGTKEVLHYQDALWEGYLQVRKKGYINTNLFIEIFNIIKETSAGVRNTPGTKISNKQNSEIIYTPPEGEDLIRDKLKNLEDFINNELLEIPILYLSKYIIENKSAYYNGLRLVTEEGKWNEWILYILDAIEKTALYTQNKIDEIARLMTKTEAFLKDKAADIYTKELLEIIFRQPYSKRKLLEDAGLVKKKTAGTYLARLEELGTLKSIMVGKEKLYINFELFNILKK